MDWQHDDDVYDIATSAEKEALKASRTVEDIATTLEEKVDRLALVCRAMWELIRERNGLSEETLIDKVKEVDLLDGSLDGKVTIPPLKCSKCGRTVSKRHKRCIYCGSQELLDTAFDVL
jgi:predicted Zn-ribbon and HTH transcriptional regulator